MRTNVSACQRMVAAAGLAGLLISVADRAYAYPLELTGQLGFNEEYNDNVFFDDTDTDDLITNLRIGLGIRYDLPSLALNLSAASTARFFALGSQNNRIDLGDNQFMTFGTTYRATDRLTLSISDNVARVSSTRSLTLSPAEDFPRGNPGTDPGTTPPDGNEDPSPGPDPTTPGGADTTSNEGDTVGDLLLPRGSALSNALLLGAGYLISPLWGTNVSYSNRVSNFTDPDSTDIWHRAGTGVSYAWSPILSFNGGYGYSRFKFDTGRSAQSHNVNLGAGYQLNPTWSVSGSGGVFFNQPLGSNNQTPDSTSNSVSNRVGFSGFLATTKLFQDSSINIGVRQGVTPSAGVAGLSLTQSGSFGYQAQLLEWLDGWFNINFTNYDTDAVDFRALYTITGLVFPIWRDIDGGLFYSYRWRDSDESTDELSAGSVDGNVISFRVGTSLPLWQGDL